MGSHGSRFVEVFRLTQIPRISRFSFVGGKSHGGSTLVCFLGLTQIAQISQGFPLWVENLTEALRFVVFCGLTRIQREDYLWKFVLIRGRKKTPNLIH